MGHRMRCWVAATALGTAAGYSSTRSASSTGGPRVAAVHLFEWSWPDVAWECETFLGPQGYDGVQISPPTEHITGPEWWTRYQPVSYKLVSRSGDEASFRDMVQRCNTAGVMVIVDAVVNHMAKRGSRGVAGSTFGNRTYPAVPYSQEDLHHLRGDPSKNCLADYHVTHSMQWCDLGGLPDLCTECPNTRARIVEFLQNVLSYGQNIGFRFDAAKSIPVDSYEALMNEIGTPWQYAEVHSVPEDPAPLQPLAYSGAGHVTEFEYSVKVGEIFKEGDRLGRLQEVGESAGLVRSDKAVVFIENHDTMRPLCMACAPINHDDGDKYILANVFMLAWPYGYPLVMSSYAYPPGDHDQGPPPYPVHCGSTSWHCEHRRPEIANMVAWRRIAGASDVQDFTSDEDEAGRRVYFNRGGVAFVALNRDEAHPWSAWVYTGLPPGSYCDVIQSDDVLLCPRLEVNGSGFTQIKVKPLKAVALHLGKAFAGERNEVQMQPWIILALCISCLAAPLLYFLGLGTKDRRKKLQRRSDDHPLPPLVPLSVGQKNQKKHKSSGKAQHIGPAPEHSNRDGDVPTNSLGSAAGPPPQGLVQVLPGAYRAVPAAPMPVRQHPGPSVTVLHTLQLYPAAWRNGDAGSAVLNGAE